MRRLPRTLLLALGLIAFVVLGTSSATAARPAPSSPEIVISVNLVHDTAAQSCDLAWTFRSSNTEPVRDYAVVISNAPLQVGKSLPGGNILIPTSNGWIDNDLPEGATSYFYVQAVYTDGKSSQIASASRTCG